LILIILLLAIPCHARIITVNWDGTGDFNNIQAAINDANDGDTVIVADGIYTGDGNWDIDFLGKSITVRSENGPTNCIVDCNGTLSDTHSGFDVGPNSVLDGFTIRNGYDSRGVGIYMYSFCDFCNFPHIRNCIIRDNHAVTQGGGIYVATSYRTGGAFITNCSIVGNSADLDGGGIFVNQCNTNVYVRNSILWGNTAGSNGDMIDLAPGKGCETIAYVDFSVLQSDWYYGGNNIVADPCFADADNGDYHLKSQAGRWDPNTESWVIDAVTSPAIDAGDPADPVGFEPFPNGGIINMGAYGGTAEASKSYFGIPPCETIVAGDINGDCKVNFLDFRLMALHWLENNNP